MSSRHEPGLEAVEISSDQRIGEGGFLVLRRLELRNRRPGGELSEIYKCDFVERPVGLDAVAIAIYRLGGQGCEVLLRSGLRPPLAFGRQTATPVVESRGPWSIEIAAGIIEASDEGLEGVRGRAVAEVHEEVGFVVKADELRSLGAPIFPAPGVCPERLYLFAVELDASATPAAIEGDGSLMEEGATVAWWPLGEAIEACVSGEIEDAKTEIALRRLRDQLG